MSLERMWMKNANDDILNLNVKMLGAVSMVIIPEDELSSKKIESVTAVTKPVGIEFGSESRIIDNNGNVVEDELFCLGVISDPIYKNIHMIMYSKNEELLFTIPDLTREIGLFNCYDLEVQGISLVTGEVKRSDNTTTHSLDNTFTNIGKIKLDTTKLNTISFKTHSLVVNVIPQDEKLNRPNYIRTSGEHTILRDDTHMSLGLELIFPDGVILNKQIHAGIFHGLNRTSCRQTVMNVEVNRIKDFTKICFIA